MPCKHRRPGSIPGVSTCATGSRKTVICLIRNQEKPGSTPGVPTCGSLVKSESRAVEAREVPGRFGGGTTAPYWRNG